MKTKLDALRWIFFQNTIMTHLVEVLALGIEETLFELYKFDIILIRAIRTLKLGYESHVISISNLFFFSTWKLRMTQNIIS